MPKEQLMAAAGGSGKGELMDKSKESKVPMFAWMVPHLTKVARECGYALALHGSMVRDLDLIAVPWVDDAKSPEELAEALRAAVDGKIDTLAHVGWDGPDSEDPHKSIRENPTQKPHGRRAWSIYFSGRAFYIDLSVMPLLAEAGRSN
jgi:hypothetical protein